MARPTPAHRALLSAALLLTCSLPATAAAQTTGATLAVRPASGAPSSITVDSIGWGSAPMRAVRGGSIGAPAGDARTTVSFAGPGVVSSTFASTMSQAQKLHQTIREMVLSIPVRNGTQRYSFVDCAVDRFYVLNGASRLVVRPTQIIASETPSTPSKSGTTFDAKVHNE